MKPYAAAFVILLSGCIKPPAGQHQGTATNRSPEAQKLVGTYRMEAKVDPGSLPPDADLRAANQIADMMAAGDNAQTMDLASDGKYVLTLRREKYSGEWNLKQGELILSDPVLNGVSAVEPAIPGRLKLQPDGSLEFMRTKESTTGASIIIRYVRA